MRDYGSKHILFEECKCTDERWWNDVKSRGRSAILVTIPEAVKKQEFWIPFSQVHDDSEVYQKKVMVI